MANIPTFKNEEDGELYLSIYKDKLQEHFTLLSLAKDKLIGDKFTFASIPGDVLEVLNDMVRNLAYEASEEFKIKHPEYKQDEDDIFIPYRSFQENVLVALKTALKEINSEEG